MCEIAEYRANPDGDFETSKERAEFQERFLARDGFEEAFEELKAGAVKENHFWRDVESLFDD